MKVLRSIAGLAALTSFLTLATGSARADLPIRHVPSLNLTPYHLVLNPDGLCASTGSEDGTNNAILETCDNANVGEVFYLLKSDSDQDFVWQNVPPGTRPSLRIAAAEKFDSTSGGYVYVEAGADVNPLDGTVDIDTDDIDDPVSPANLWYVDAVPVPAPTWTHVADEGQSFSVGGRRTFRFGVNGVYATRIVEGNASGIEAVGQCTSAFFGASPGPGSTCDVQAFLDAPTPYRVLLETSRHVSLCLSRVQHVVQYQQLAASRCNPARPDYPTVWTLVPVPHLQYR